MHRETDHQDCRSTMSIIWRNAFRLCLGLATESRRRANSGGEAGGGVAPRQEEVRRRQSTGPRDLTPAGQRRALRVDRSRRREERGEHGGRKAGADGWVALRGRRRLWAALTSPGPDRRSIASMRSYLVWHQLLRVFQPAGPFSRARAWPEGRSTSVAACPPPGVVISAAKEYILGSSSLEELASSKPWTLRPLSAYHYRYRISDIARYTPPSPMHLTHPLPHVPRRNR